MRSATPGLALLLASASSAAQAATCAPSPPVPIRMEYWFSSGPTYPTGPHDREGTVRFLVEVGANGLVRSCNVVVPSGDHRLDETTCKEIKRRARFTPAIDQHCSPVAGVYTNAVHWKLPD